MAEKHCKAMVTPEDGGEPYPCKLGVWQKHPKDGYCYMHHPKVTLRGGAARAAIDKGDVAPKTPKAKRRQKLVKKGKKHKKQEVIKPTEMTFDYIVHFVEHRAEGGKLVSERGTVGFASKSVANNFAEALTHTTPRAPLINRNSVYFYTDVELEEREE